MKEFDASFEPVIGKFYLVPHAVLEHFYDKDKIFVPVLGNAHSDSQFGINFEHYHIDGRFKNSRFIMNEGRTNAIIPTDSQNQEYHFKEIVYLKRKCISSDTGILVPKTKEQNPKKNVGLYHSWVDSMIGKTCKGKKCPHLGVLMLDKGDTLVCPLHALKADKETLKITGYEAI